MLCQTAELAVFGGRSHKSYYALGQILSVRVERLDHFPESDVVLEGGELGTTVAEFIALQPELCDLPPDTMVTRIEFMVIKEM